MDRTLKRYISRSTDVTQMKFLAVEAKCILNVYTKFHQDQIGESHATANNVKGLVKEKKY